MFEYSVRSAAEQPSRWGAVAGQGLNDRSGDWPFRGNRPGMGH